MATIKESDWLEELRKLSVKNDAGLTAQEWSEKLGWSEKTTLNYLKKAQGLGWLHRGERSSTTLHGRPYFVPVYSIRKPK